MVIAAGRHPLVVCDFFCVAKKVADKYLDDLIGDIADYGWNGTPLNVIVKDGKIQSLDNRRLAAGKVLDIDVPVSIRNLNEKKWRKQFNRKKTGVDAGTGGLFIDIKGTGIPVLDGSHMKL